MKPLIAFVVALAAVALLSSCTRQAPDGHTDHEHGDQSSQAAASAPSNAADVAFATNMIPHHQQAVDLAGLVPTRSSDPAVVELAAAISAEQEPEIGTLEALLGRWNADGVDATHDTHGPGMQMDAAQMQGMVDDATMTTLKSLRGADFDRLWLQSMIGHHRGAIEMAKTEIADGANPDAKTLAQQIVTAQAAELDQMRKMLGA